MNYREIIDKINAFAFLLFILVSPVHMRLQILAFAFWIFTHLLTIVFHDFSSPEIKNGWSFIALVLLFATYAFSLTYSDNFIQSIKLLETKLALIILPFVFFTRTNPYINFKSISIAVCIGFLFSILVILGKTMIDLISENKAIIDYAESVIKLIQLEIYSLNHRLYWGLFNIWSLVSLFYLFNHLKEKSKTYYLLFLSLLLLNIFFLMINGSRIIWGISIATSFWLINYKKHKIIILSSIGIGIIIIGYLAIPRFIHFFQMDSIPLENLQYAEPRVFIWPVSVECIKANWLWGYGIGDVKEVLLQAYHEKGYTDAVKNQYIAHNQFLQTWLETGIIGLLVLLYTIYAIGRFIFKSENRKYLFCLYFAIFISMMAESILNRLQGVVLFSLIPYLALISNKNSKTPLLLSIQFRYQKIILCFIGCAFISLAIIFLIKPKADTRKPETFLTKPHIGTIISENDSIHIPSGTPAWYYTSECIKEHLDSGNNFYEIIYTTKKIFADSLTTSVYCKATQEFQGSVALHIGSASTGYESYSYNFDNPGKWQKLTVKKKLNKGTEHVILHIKPQEKNFTGEIFFTSLVFREK